MNTCKGNLVLKWDMKIIKPIFLLLWSTSVLIFSFGCASLPKVSEVMQEAADTQETPQILSARGFLSSKQSQTLIERLKRRVDPTDLLENQIAVMEAVSGSPLIKGNKVRLLIDGPATYTAMFRAVENAKDHINIETFIFEDIIEGGETGRSFADLLLQKQSEGVQVNLMYDSVGSLGTPADLFKRLRDGGIQVLEFNPINPLTAHGRWRITHRDHRKVLIVDGKIVITGGINISRVYSSGLSGAEQEGKTQLPWRDTDVQIEGPAVAEFQQLFLDSWQRQKGQELLKRNYFPKLEEAGNDLLQVAGSTPGQMNRINFIMYVSAITFAENTIHLTNAYFVPDGQTVKALTEAARHSVDVKIILPSMSDSPLAFYAGKYYYSDLLKSGVKLYERRNVILHAKTAVIDGVWSTVGSTNMDFWSFLNNDEVNAEILSREFAVEMEKMFANDIAESEQIKWEEWNERPLFPRIREWIAHLFAHWL
jgi:cardiolipin synthase